MTDNTMRAARPGNSRRRPKTFDDGRVCGSEECTTQVSRYNRSDLCFRHRPVKYPRLRGVLTEERTV